MEGRKLVLLFSVSTPVFASPSIKSLLNQISTIGEITIETATTRNCIQFSKSLLPQSQFVVSNVWDPHYSDTISRMDVASEEDLQRAVEGVKGSQVHIVRRSDLETVQDWEDGVSDRFRMDCGGVRILVVPPSTFHLCLRLANSPSPTASFAFLDFASPSNTVTGPSLVDLPCIPQFPIPPPFISRNLLLINSQVFLDDNFQVIKDRIEGLSFKSLPIRIESSIHRQSIELSHSLQSSFHCDIYLNPALNPSPDSEFALDIPDESELTEFINSLTVPITKLPDFSAYENKLKSTVFMQFSGYRILVVSEDVLREICENVLRIGKLEEESLIVDVNLDFPERTKIVRNSEDFGSFNLLQSLDKMSNSGEIDEEEKKTAEMSLEDLKAEEKVLKKEAKSDLLPLTHQISDAISESKPGIHKNSLNFDERTLKLSIKSLSDSLTNELFESVLGSLYGDMGLEKVNSVVVREEEEEKAEEIEGNSGKWESDTVSSKELGKEIGKFRMNWDKSESEMSQKQASDTEISEKMPEKTEIIVEMPILEGNIEKETVMEEEKTVSRVEMVEKQVDFPEIQVNCESIGSISQLSLEIPTYSPVLAEIPCETRSDPSTDHQKRLSSLNSLLNRRISDTIIEKISLCSKLPVESDLEMTILKSIMEENMIEKRVNELEECIERIKGNVRDRRREVKEEVGKLSEELMEIQEKEREMQRKLSEKVREIVLKAGKLREKIEERGRMSQELYREIEVLRVPIEKPQKVVIHGVRVTESGSLQADVVLRSFHSYPVFAHIYNAKNYSKRIPLTLAAGMNTSLGLGRYFEHPIEELGLVFEKVDQKMISNIAGFKNNYIRTDIVPDHFQDTYLAKNTPDLAGVMAELSEQKQQILSEIARAWVHPKLEQVAVVLRVISQPESRELQTVCSRLRSEGLLFAGLDF